MVQLAERQAERPVERSTGAIAIGAALALTIVASLRTGGSQAALPPIVVEPTAIELHAPPPCPAEVRASLHLASPTSVRCIAGNYGEPGFFVHATYDTTETWERYGVVAPDGRVLVAMVDRPQLRSQSFVAADLDGDGVDEIVGFLPSRSEVAIDVMQLHGDALAVSSQRIPVDGGRLPALVVADREVRIYNTEKDSAVYRLDRGWLVFAGLSRDL